MDLRYITCSDPHEHISYKDMVDLSNVSPLTEFGIQAHSSSMSYKQSRNEWFSDILLQAKHDKKPVQIALHINYEWCFDMCNGKIPDIISKWLAEKHVVTGRNIIKRVQLNIGSGMCMTRLNHLATAVLIYENPQFEFIFPYNDLTRDFIEKLHKTNVKFDLLYDSSYGVGKSPDKWYAPVYQEHNHGYAGGLSANNVKDNLIKIDSVLPDKYSTWIDAEGQLMHPGTRTMDINRAKQYIENALQFLHSKDNQK